MKTYQDFLKTEIISKEHHVTAVFQEIDNHLYIVCNVAEYAVKIPFHILYTPDMYDALLIAAKQLLNACLSLKKDGVLMKGTIYD